LLNLDLIDFAQITVEIKSCVVCKVVTKLPNNLQGLIVV